MPLAVAWGIPHAVSLCSLPSGNPYLACMKQVCALWIPWILRTGCSFSTCHRKQL